MAKATSKLKCPGCDHENEVLFKKPSIHSPTVHKVVCKSCQSGILFLISVPPRTPTGEGRKPGEINVQSKLSSIGAPLAVKWHARYLQEQAEKSARGVTDVSPLVEGAQSEQPKPAEANP